MPKKKKKDPEAPYYEKPTPGKPGWNLAKKAAKKRQAAFQKAKRSKKV